ncbi:S-adenosylmethionine synthetase [Phyllosticta citricarpa]
MIMVFGEITTKATSTTKRSSAMPSRTLATTTRPRALTTRPATSSLLLSSSRPTLPRVSTMRRLWRSSELVTRGIMFGYASDETPELLPMTIQLAHKLNAAMKEARNNGTLPWLRPDTKTQVTIEYAHDGGAVVPKRVDTVVVSAQHSEDITTELLRKEIKENIIKKVIPANLLDDKTVYHIQPSGLFIIGGPQGDAGLTGRKIIDYSKVDRSAAYLARWIAKSLIKAGLARRALVQLSYAIGVAEPLSVFVETYGTSDKSSDELVEIIRNNFDMRPGVIVRELNLTNPIYRRTARTVTSVTKSFPWEQPKQLKF